MLFQRINRSDPEKVFIVVKNSDATAITVGMAVCFDYATDQDGVGVDAPATAILTIPAGIVEDTSIAAGSYGLVQVYGHNANALVDGTTGLGAGDPLQMTDGSFTLSLVTAGAETSDAVAYYFVAGEAYTTGTGAAKKVFIRCL
jgi:hypothetical protein